MSVPGFRVDTSKFDIDASEFHRTLTDHVNRGQSITVAPSPDAYVQPGSSRLKKISWVPRPILDEKPWREAVTEPPKLDPTKPLDEAAREYATKPVRLSRAEHAAQMADDAVAIFDVGGAPTREMILEDGLKDLQEAVTSLVSALK